MNERDHLSQLPRKWHEARRRAECYLRALRGAIGAAEGQLVIRALTMARAQHGRDPATHPVTMVMETLFDLLPVGQTSVPMAPPIQRATMLPEPMEFPVRDWLRRCFRRPRVVVAGPN